MAKITQTASDTEKAILVATLRSLEPFKNIRDTIPLQYVIAFLLVAAEEGKNVTEYAKDAGISPSLMTRQLADLGTTNRYHTEGFGLVEQMDDPLDKRVRLMRLTAKGKGIMSQIVRAHRR